MLLKNRSVKQNQTLNQEEQVLISMTVGNVSYTEMGEGTAPFTCTPEAGLVAMDGVTGSLSEHRHDSGLAWTLM